MSNTTDTVKDSVSSLQRKNELLQGTLEMQGVCNAKLKRMLNISIDQSLFVADHLKEDAHQKRFRELEKLAGKSADDIHPGKVEATADECGKLDG